MTRRLRAPRATIPPDFHCALLWIRSMEILQGHTTVKMLFDPDMHDLFAQYRSPWSA
jgi:hypothetical protein